MPQVALKKDARVVYYAEGQPYKGPFPALVDEVLPAGEEEDKPVQPRLNLRVFFNGLENEPKVKSNVPFELEPTKHHWSWTPADWAWPEVKAAAPEVPAKKS